MFVTFFQFQNCRIINELLSVSFTVAARELTYSATPSELLQAADPVCNTWQASINPSHLATLSFSLSPSLCVLEIPGCMPVTGTHGWFSLLG